LPYLQEAELMNGRWAMHATAGILFTDAVGLPKFWEAGEVSLNESGFDFKLLVAFQVLVNPKTPQNGKPLKPKPLARPLKRLNPEPPTSSLRRHEHYTHPKL
jgi:hypothetical protein